MIQNDILIYFSLMSSLLLFPILAYFDKKSALLLFIAVFFTMTIFYMKDIVEKYERMDFFPWNEAKLVKKRDRDSTVIDCAWYLDQEKNDNIFKLSDPIVCGNQNLSS